jgi:lipid-A-disaccharide synthase-like uncharacterized protein
MTEALREYLYPLGFISSLAFTARFLVQWLNSEKKQQSVVTPLFWKLSLIGNGVLWIHSIIQVQLHVALIQICNAVISWRNLNLMQPTNRHMRLVTVMGLLVAGLSGTIVLFLLQLWGTEGVLSFFRMPTWLGSASRSPIFWGWHLVGIAGLILFNSRFWIQWWLAEKDQKSYLGPSFWWMSLAGDLMCLIYFTVLGDSVNFIGPVFGLVPYIRNLMLLYKKTNPLPSESPP